MRAIIIFMELVIGAGILLGKIVLLILGVVLAVQMFLNPSIMAALGVIGVLLIIGQIWWKRRRSKQKK